MARLESQAVAGFYPTPQHLLRSISSLVELPDPPRHWDANVFVVFDPCAGDGAAVAELVERWGERRQKVKVVACEMEGARYQGLVSRCALRKDDEILHGDAFCLAWHRPAATVLYLNPPYDSDRDYKRLEARWLARFAPTLVVGGVLLFVIPAQALPACAAALAKGFTELRCYRFPPEDYAAFGQVVVAGRRQHAVGYAQRQASEADVRQWAREPESLPQLVGNLAPFRFDSAEGHGLSVKLQTLDIAGAVQSHRAWSGLGTGVHLGVDELIGRQYPTAMPPKPAHLALALAAGHFNGHRVRPNRGLQLPPLIVKGVFHRERLRISENRTPKGHLQSAVEVEQPKLRMSALRMDTFEFFEPSPGTDLSDSTRLLEFNTADVVENYSDAFAALMAQQFPAMHDPANPTHRMALPPLLREPMRAQREAIIAALKLIARGDQPKFASEVGTGKTTMALYVAAALHPDHHARTLRALQQVPGFGASTLPVVRRTLVVCPPHLLKSWADQAAAVWPSARVQVLSAISDVWRDEAEIHVLSRETAKLGHGLRGVSGACPRCGATNAESPADLARTRHRCRAQRREPANATANLAMRIAEAMVAARPEDEVCRMLVGDRRYLRLRTLRPPSPSGLNRTAFRGLVQPAAAQLMASLQNYAWNGAMIAAVAALARAADPRVATVGLLHQLVGEHNAREDAERGYAFPPGQYRATDVVMRLAARLFDEERGTSPGMDEDEQLSQALRGILPYCQWAATGSCDEPLYQATPEPRRYPLANYIARHAKGQYQLLILDEAHEFNNQGTAQQKAAHRLVEVGLPTLALTGSMMSGYASSLFANWWALNPEFRAQFGRDEKALFVEQYGYRKVAVSWKKAGAADEDEEDEAARAGRALGVVTDREDGMTERILGEVPGVMPLFLLRHLLPTAVLVHKSDLENELPALREHQHVIEPSTEQDAKLLAAYRVMQQDLVAAIANDAFTKMAGKLWGAMSELPSYLDRCTADHGPFELRYPEDCGGELVARGVEFPEEYRTPKERWLLDQLQGAKATGRRTIVFVRHSGSALPQRLLRLVKAEVTRKVVFLDARKTTAAKREEWIDKHVIATGTEVLIVNPNAVRTGLNNLVAFNVAVWYESEYSAQTFRQACGRLHRIGQENEVDIHYPFYGGTTQAVAVDLVARKVTASLQVDGLTVQGALESAGAGEAEREATEFAMQMGEAIYRRITAPKRQEEQKP